MATPSKYRGLKALTGVGCLALSCVGLTACGQKEAEDPRKILGDWMEHDGADGNASPSGSKQPRSTAGQSERRVASKAECHAAAKRIEELALELAVTEAESDQERSELEKRSKEEVKSAVFQARVNQATNDCLARETTDLEAHCVAKAKRALDIDRCTSR